MSGSAPPRELRNTAILLTLTLSRVMGWETLADKAGAAGKPRRGGEAMAVGVRNLRAFHRTRHVHRVPDALSALARYQWLATPNEASQQRRAAHIAPITP